MNKAFKLLLIIIWAMMMAYIQVQPASARAPMAGVVDYFPAITASRPFNSFVAYNSTMLNNATAGISREAHHAGTPAEEMREERIESMAAVGPKNHMQFELYTGMPRSISYWKPVDGLLAEKIGEEPGIVAMRLTGLMVGGRRVDMAGRVCL
ncbi:hypothetical protein [Methanocella conradii]|uniref:hypothetical protein n=1 Tax=Methanocella conradii TaxID=1175444 RepID=UPI00157DADE4|nr:hypothetical protein [Methanocella conradii]